MIWLLAPNPSSNYLEISIQDQKEDYIVKIFSVIGELIAETTIIDGSFILNTTNWASGMYSVVLQNSKEEIQGIKKIVVAR